MINPQLLRCLEAARAHTDALFSLVRPSAIYKRPIPERHRLVFYIGARLGNNIDVQATTISSPQIEMTSFATDTTVAPGTQFSLVLDVRQREGFTCTRQA